LVAYEVVGQAELLGRRPGDAGHSGVLSSSVLLRRRQQVPGPSAHRPPHWQGLEKNKPLRGRLGGRWETLSGYDLNMVHRTGKTNSANGLSRRPDYKAAAEAKDQRKVTERPSEANWSIDDAQSSAVELEEGREKVARISTA
jgi:hypothetical protein